MITDLFYSHIINMNRGSLFIQGLPGVYTSLFLGTDDLKMALRVRKVSGALEKRAPGLCFWEKSIIFDNQAAGALGVFNIVFSLFGSRGNEDRDLILKVTPLQLFSQEGQELSTQSEFYSRGLYMKHSRNMRGVIVGGKSENKLRGICINDYGIRKQHPSQLSFSVDIQINTPVFY